MTSRAEKTETQAVFFECRGGGLRWNLLALCVVILNQVLEEVHSLLGLDLIYFDQVLQKKERGRVQPGGEIQGVFKGFLVV